MPRCSGLDSHNERTPILRVPLQTGLRFHSRRYEQPPHRKACRITNSRWLAGDCSTGSDNDLRLGWLNSSSDDLRANAAVKGPSPTPHTRGEDKPSKPKSRRSDRRWRRRSRWRRQPPLAATTSAPTTQPPAHQHRTSELQLPRPAPADPHSHPPRRAGADLRTEASCRSEDKTIQEHERRPRGVRRLVRSPGAHGAIAARAVDG
jgi:hypothetical protein